MISHNIYVLKKVDTHVFIPRIYFLEAFDIKYVIYAKLEKNIGFRNMQEKLEQWIVFRRKTKHYV